MKIGIIVLCRYNSTRLYGKILKNIKNKPIIQHIIDRLKIVKGNYPIFIATSNQKDDNPIVNYCNKNKINFFRGSKTNVAYRFLKCAINMELDYAIRINGDNLFTDPYIIDKMIKLTKLKKWIFLTNILDRTFPEGISVEIVKVSKMKKEIENFNKFEKEHVMPFFDKNLKNDEIFNLKNDKFLNSSKIKLALDTNEDLERFTQVFSNMDKPAYSYRTNEIINIITNMETNS